VEARNERDPLGMRIAQLMNFMHCHTHENPSAKGIPSDYQAILADARINFRKAGANYSPLQQNHPNRSINCRSNAVQILWRKPPQSHSSHSPASR